MKHALSPGRGVDTGRGLEEGDSVRQVERCSEDLIAMSRHSRRQKSKSWQAGTNSGIPRFSPGLDLIPAQFAAGMGRTNTGVARLYVTSGVFRHHFVGRRRQCEVQD
jgi:hypothetical protein